MFETVKDIEKKYIIKFDNNYSNYNNIIIDIFNSKIIDNRMYDINDPYILNIIGLFYEHKKKNYKEMIKYFLMAIELKNSDAMHNLGKFYEYNDNYILGFYISNNYEKMEKYYLMAIELENVNAMFNLAKYYLEVKNDREKMKKYYLMAIELGHDESMCELGYYYFKYEKNYDEMKKYYLMGIELGHKMSMYNLSDYYWYENYENHYKDDKKEDYIGLYILLNNIENKNDLIKKQIDYLNKKNEIKLYKTIINLVKKNNNIDECFICLNDDFMIHMNDCNHKTCVNCFLKIENCPLCRN
jgi:hypothetical protein